ncbi:MAG: nicotinamide mononucleotide transporter family protein, partial [Pseudomonadota bacterium]
DSLTTWGAVVTTWMVTAKILENWLYWVVIDLASIYLYLERGLLQTAGLFVLYVVLAIGGYLLWRADWRERRAEPAMPADADGAARDVR